MECVLIICAEKGGELIPLAGGKEVGKIVYCSEIKWDGVTDKFTDNTCRVASSPSGAFSGSG